MSLHMDSRTNSLASRKDSRKSWQVLQPLLQQVEAALAEEETELPWRLQR